MRRLDRQLTAIGEAHPFPYAVAVGLVAGVLTLLIGWLARREWIWFLFVLPAVVTGTTIYTEMRWRQQNRKHR